MRVCFVGAGSIGIRHIRNLVSVCKDRKQSATIDLLRSTDRALPNDIKYVIDKEFMSINELEQDYDFIFITNPTYLHYKTIDLLKTYSKHFFVEKPVVSDPSQDIRKLSLPSDNLYYVACPLRYTKILRYVHDFIQTHKVFSVRAISSSYLPEWRPHVDYRKTYSADSAKGGGVCIDLIHEWDYLYSFFGKPDLLFQLSGKFSDLEISSEDLAVYIAQYKTFLLELHLDYFGRKTERKLELYCEDGTYIFDIISNQVTQNDRLVKTFEEEPNDKYVKELEYFFDVCSRKQDNSNDLYHAMEVLKITSGK